MGKGEMTEEKVPEADGTPEPVVETTGAALPSPQERTSSRSILALSALLVSAAAGFGVAWFDPFDWRGSKTISALESQISTLAGQFASAETVRSALEDRVTELESAPQAPMDGLEGILARLESVETGLAALQSAPVGGTISSTELAAMQSAIETLKADISRMSATGVQVQDAALKEAVDRAMADWATEQAARLQAAEAEAQALERRRAAIDIILAAAQTGAPFAEAVEALDGTEVPTILREYAASGLPVLSGLVDGFPDAARAALDASLRQTGAEGLTDGLLAFLRVQTGARSLQPREGTDPDAVLSRAEASVRAGDVAQALKEIAALPEAGQAAMAEWTAAAQVYLSAQAALADLAAARTED